MSVLSDISKEVETVAAERHMKPDRAFGYYFLEEVEEFSQEEAEEVVVDGPWDGGRDAVFFDEDNRVLTVYQLKYSVDLEYLKRAFADVQRALEVEEQNVKKCKQLRLVIVTIATSDDATQALLRQTGSNVKRWLTRHDLKPELVVELFDLKKFAEFRDRLFGLNITLRYQTRPAMVAGTVLGLMNASDLSGHNEEEALFAFNIRKFLGARKGSVNSQIYDSLAEPTSRDVFWTLNNGIVCLCTDYHSIDDDHVAFTNFTIVNGAQTVSTIARFLENNPAVQEPIWVVSKIIKVGEEEVERGRILTKTSNSQAPTNDKDLRAVDPIHRRLSQHLKSELGVTYLFRRGTRAPRGEPSVTMKDLAQASVAFWLEKPQVSFSRPGTIFADSHLYEGVFSSEEAAEVFRRGDKPSINTLLLRLLVPAELLVAIRHFLRQRVVDAEELKWRSTSYHLLWVLRKLVDDTPSASLSSLHAHVSDVIRDVIAPVYEALYDFLNTLNSDIPRSLKSEEVGEIILGRGFLNQSRVKDAKKALGVILDGTHGATTPS